MNIKADTNTSNEKHQLEFTFIKKWNFLPSLLCLGSFTLSLGFSQALEMRVINIDVTSVKGVMSTTPLNGVNAGRAAEGLRPDWQDQLRTLRQECGINNIRFHAIFHDEMHVYREDDQGNPIYNWDLVDKLYDFIVGIGMKPLVELSFMPGALRTNDETACNWKAYKSPPNSYPKYQALVEAFIRHVESRYGHDKVKTWYFEVWNEPNLKGFFTGTRDEYFKIYTTAARAIKRVSPDFRVGGPATAGTGWLNETMDFCEQNHVPLDFISTHFYGNSVLTDAQGKKAFFMRTDADAMPNKILEVRSTIQKHSAYKGLELLFDEFSTSYDPHDPMHDAYQSTPYLLNVLKKTENAATIVGYWAFSDIIEEIGPVPTGVCFGGWGLMDAHGLKKPAYFAYKYIHELGETELNNADANSWACKSGNDVQVLFWNYKLLDQKAEPSRTFYKKLYPPEIKEHASLKLSNLKNGTYSLQWFCTGYQANDYYTAYVNMGSPAKPTKEQMQQLADACKDAPVKTETVQVTSGMLELATDVRENDAQLLKMIYTSNPVNQ